MRSAARKSAGSLRAFRGRLLIIRIIPRGILRKVYSAIPHKNVSNLCQVPYVKSTRLRNWNGQERTKNKGDDFSNASSPMKLQCK